MWLCAPQWEPCSPFAAEAPSSSTRRGCRGSKEGPERRAATLREHGIDAINMHHTDWNGGMVALFHRFDRVAFGWDMQEPHILQAAFRMGLDGVYSDWVDRMMDVYRPEIGQPPDAAVVRDLRRDRRSTASASRRCGQTITNARPIRVVVRDLADRGRPAVERGGAVVAHHEDVVRARPRRAPANRRSDLF